MPGEGSMDGKAGRAAVLAPCWLRRDVRDRGWNGDARGQTVGCCLLLFGPVEERGR